MKQVQRGFTLIELVMVIVIIGILAAVAMPQYVNLSTEAKKAKANGIAGAIASSAAIQYAAIQVKGGTYTPATACTGGVYLQPTGIPGGCSAAGSNDGCTVTCDGKTSASITYP